MNRRTHWPWYGFAFGCVLFVFAFGSFGAGHGSYLPLALFAAPISLVPLVGLFSAPVWWAVVGWTLKDAHRVAQVLLMALHTCAMGLILWFGTPGESGSEQWRYFAKTQGVMPVWLWSGIIVYAIGLFVAWLLVLMPPRRELIRTTVDAARG